MFCKVELLECFFQFLQTCRKLANMLNPRALKLFHLIADTGSLSAAAEDFNLSPPAASRLISLLEDDLGFQLFSREGRNLTLTDQGRQFLTETRNILTSFESINTLAEQIRTKSPPQLRVLSTAPCVVSWISPAIARLKAAHPELKCNIQVVDWHSLQENLGASSHDISVSSFPISSAVFALETKVLCHFRNVAVMHKSNPLAEKDEVTADDLVNYPMVGLQKNQIGRQRADEFFTASGLEMTPDIETSSSLVSLALCRQNLGVAIMPAIQIHGFDFEGLVARPIVPERWITFGALTSKSNPFSAIQMELIGHLKDVSRSWEWTTVHEDS
jgi:DNA-binding transcriptional LysR family regulator